MKTYTQKAIKKKVEKNKSYLGNYKLLIENAKDLIVEITPSGTLKYVNPAYCKLFGKNEKKFAGKSFMAMIHAKDREATAKAMGIMKKKPYCAYVEHRALTKKGLRWLAWSGKSVVRDGKVYSIIGIGQDITERKKFAEELKKNSERYRQLNELYRKILDNAPVSIMLINKDGTIVSMNKFGLKLMKKTEKEAINRKIVETRNIKYNDYLKNKYSILLKAGVPFRYNNLLYHSEKNASKKIYLDIIAAPVLNEKAEIDGAISMALDNTKSYLYEKRIEKLNQELEEKVKQRTRQLEKALDLKSKFIADASHELRTPLTIIQGNLDLIENRLDNNLTDNARIIKMEIKGMSKILADLSMLTNDKLKEEKLNLEKIRLDSLLKIIGRSLKVLADTKKIKIEYVGKIKKTEIWGDEQKIERLFLNIVRNAIKYTNENGKIKIRLKSNKEGAFTSIEDNGIGILKKDLPYIFERFYRTDKSRSKREGGAGLGLAISKWVAEKHNGKIEVQSSFGKGSIFKIYLPYNNPGIIDKNEKKRII